MGIIHLFYKNQFRCREVNAALVMFLLGSIQAPRLYYYKNRINFVENKFPYDTDRMKYTRAAAAC
jgi:hypothetical protein